jgi:hypothetical protein
LFLRDIIGKIIGKKPCAICSAVSLTWLGSLVLKFLGFPADNLLIGILMGGSVVGGMYYLEEKFHEKKWSFWFARLIIIIGGFSGVYFLGTNNYSYFIADAIGAGLLFVMVLVSQWQANSVPNYDGVPADTLEQMKKKLENCCGGDNH